MSIVQQLFRALFRLSFVGIGACGGAAGGAGLSPLDDSGADGSTSGAKPDASMGSGGEASVGSCTVDTAQFDHSCSVDSDCVDSVDYPYAGLGPGSIPVAFGDYCTQDACHNCSTGEVINKKDVPAYVADLRGTPVGSGSILSAVCSCPARPPAAPCCQQGTCTECVPDGGDGYSGAAYIEAGVLCGVDSGVIDSGDAGSETTDVCYPGLSCMQYNGAWRCCFGGQIQHCRVPVADGGSD